MRARTVSTGTVALLVALAAGLGACGGDDGATAAKGPPGSPDNPLVSKAQPDGTDPDAPGQTGGPNFRDLVREQSRRPGERESPCALVTRQEAQAALGVRLQDPFEAPQGPTCIYRSEKPGTFVTLAVQDDDFGRLRRQLDRRRSIEIAGSTGYCGTNGAPVLYLPLSGGRVLSVGGQCEDAAELARSAARRLDR